MPNYWKKYKLGDLCNDISYGYTESAAWDKIGPKFLRITDIQNDFINWETVPYCKISEKDRLKYQLYFGDIVIARTGNSTGATAIIKDSIEAVYASYLIRYSLKRELAYPFFIGHILKSQIWKGFVQSIISGSAQPGANAKQFAEFEITLPPLPEQQAIAEILSALDDKIELNLQTNKTLEEMANALYKHWFVDFGPFKNGKFIESELGMIPEEWEVKKTSSLFDLTIGRTPPRKEQHWFSEDIRDIKWISIKDMGTSGAYIFSTSEYLTKEAVEKHNVPLIPQNTVVLSFKLTVGRISITSEEMTSNEAIAHFIPNSKNHLSTEFTYLLLKNFNFDQLGSTSSIATAVNSQTIKNIDFLYPSKNHIELFNAHVGNLFEQIKLNIVETETLKQTRDYLLPKLISGQIRIKDAVKLF